jgi:glycosidase
MLNWSTGPRIYEINTRVWLTQLSQDYNQSIHLDNIPDEVLDELVSYEVDAIWLMGVWQRGPATRASALNYIHEYRYALPDITPEDVIGSAYAIHDYVVEPAIGGREALARLRLRLQQRGLRLVLDFVPNHVATDHEAIRRHPEYFVQGTADLIKRDTTNFFATFNAKGDPIVIARGRDPYFPGWIDTAQLNVLSPGGRAMALEILLDIASQCDGIRCDMAMLVMNEIFVRSWGWLGLKAPKRDYWETIIPKVKARFPECLFIAEAYWNMEYALQQQGFDYTYDKTMYDRLLKGDVNGLYLHMSANLDYLKHNIRFIENHDEHRAASAFGPDRSRPAAALICTLPGAVLLHDGQFSGRKVKLPVHISRQPYEEEFTPLYEFYMNLLVETRDDIYRTGQWSLFRCYAASDGSEGAGNIVAYGWRKGNDFRLVVLNMAESWSQALIGINGWIEDLKGKSWLLYNTLHNYYIEEEGDRMAEAGGLRVDVEGNSAHIYRFLPVKPRITRRPVTGRLRQIN